jgi:hypothetical protein
LIILDILIVFLAILLIILFLLFNKVKITIKFNKEGKKFNSSIEIRWLFFKLFYKDFINDKVKNNDKVNVNSKSDDKINVKSKNKKDIVEIFNSLKELISLIKINQKELISLIMKIIRSCNLEKFHFKLDFGFSSPYDTVMLFTNLQYIFTVANIYENCDLSAETNFNKEIFDFNGEILFKIRLILPFFGFLTLLSKKSGLKMIKLSKDLVSDTVQSI